MTLLLQQDDCAPDASEYFWMEVRQKYGLGYKDFQSVRDELLPDGDGICLRWEHGAYILEYSADDPYYKLYLLDIK